jgi:hypothetical protein
MKRSIFSINVMTSLYSVVLITAQERNADGTTCDVQKFFPATTDVDVLNSYIEEMTYKQDLFGLTETKEAPAPAAPAKAAPAKKQRSAPEAIPSAAVATNVLTVPLAPVAPAVLTSAPVATAPAPVEAPVAPAPVATSPAPVVTPAAAPVAAPTVAPAAAPVAPSTNGIKYYTAPMCDPEVKHVVGGWFKTALGGSQVPASMVQFVEAVKQSLLSGDNGKPFPILINGCENENIKQWFITTIKTQLANVQAQI